MPYRIGHFIDDLQPAGAQLVLKLILRRLSPEPFVNFVYAFRDGEIGDQIREMGISVTILKKRSKLDPALVLQLRQRLRHDRIQILNTHIFGASTHGFVAARLAGRMPVVVTEHNVNDFYPRMRRVINRYLYPVCDAVVAVSPAVADAIARMNATGRRLVVIPNGIDVDRFAGCREHRGEARERMGVPDDATLIGNVAHLQPQKNQSALIQALSGIRDKGHNAYLAIIGDDLGDGPMLRSQAEALGVAEQVRLLGKRTDVPLLLGGMDTFALSSLWEGLPMSLLEAMAGGLPCVVTAAGGIPSVIQDGANGLLVPTGNTDALTHALLRVVESPELARRLAGAGHATVEERFSDRTMAAGYERLYLELLGDNSAADAVAARAVGSGL